MPRIPRQPKHVNADFVVIRTPAQKRARKSVQATKMFEQASHSAQQLLTSIKDGSVDYTKVSPLAAVGMFIFMHTYVYSVEPAELRDRNVLLGASSAARRILSFEFGGQMQYLCDFVRWTWACEKKTFATRSSDFRIGWRYQFCSKALLTDYKIAIPKQAKFG